MVDSALEEATPAMLLSDRERREGVAIRVQGCVRWNEEDFEGEPEGFLWSVLVVHRGDPSPQARLHGPSRLFCRLTGNPSQAELLKSSTVQVDGEPWVADEYAITVPRPLRSFVVEAGSQTLGVSRAQRNRCVLEWFERIRNAFADEEAYPRWLEAHRGWMAQHVPVPPQGVKISIVTPVYRTPPDYLHAMMDSVLAQTYDNWELVIVNASPDDKGVADVLASYDDRRIVVVEQRANEGIVGNTNVGIAATTGDYIAFLDHDDFIEPFALAAIAGSINRDPSIDLLYCDEDSYRDGSYCLPLFKPDMNWDLLYSNNYIIHFLVVSRRALERVELSTREVEGAQDYDLTFKVIEGGGAVRHLPFVLYHWRMHALSTNANAGSKPYAQEAGRLAIQRHFERCNVPAEVGRDDDNFYHVRYEANLRGTPVRLCSFGGACQEQTRAALLAWGGSHGCPVDILTVDASEGEKGLRAALKEAREGLLVITTPDVLCDEDAFEVLFSHFCRPAVFSVAPKVLRGDGLVESSGCMVTPDGFLVELGKGLPESDPAYVGRAMRPMDHLVVQNDMVVVRAPLLGEYLENEGTSAYESVLYALNDACAQAYRRGMDNVFTPYAVVRLTGPRPLGETRLPSSANDRSQFLRRNADLLREGDPSHNVNFDADSPYYRLGKRQLV